MNRARLLILLIAIIAGGAAFFMVASNDAPEATVASVIPQQKEVEMARVLIANEDIPQGAVLNSTLTGWVKWPANSVPEFYVTEANSDFMEQLPQMRARQMIRANEPIFEQNVVRHGDRGMMAAIMTPGMRAVTARMSAEQTSGGFILPGDKVDVFASGIELSDPNAVPRSWPIMTNVRVLAIDQIYANEEGVNAVVGKTVTLEVAPEQVRSFIEARDNQTLTLVLRSVFDADIVQEFEQTEPDEVVVIRYGQG